MKLDVLVLLLLSISLHVQICASTSTSPITSTSTSTSTITRTNTYSLSYEGVVSADVVKAFSEKDEASMAGIIPYSMVTDLATELATDIIQLYAVTRTVDGTMTPDDRKLDMDRRCYQSIMGGGRCNIDHYRPNEAVIQFSIQFDHQHQHQQQQQQPQPQPQKSSSGIVAKLEVTLTANTAVARDVLVRSIPKINTQLKCFQGMLWAIRERPTSAAMAQTWESPSSFIMAKHQVKSDAHQASLECLILERSDLDKRMRLVSSSNKGEPQREVWQYSTPESKYGVRSLFIDGFLQSTTHPSGTAHVEALVHPGLLSVSSDKGDQPPRVVIISQEPTAIVREVLKHKRVQSITLLGVDTEALRLAQQYLYTQNDCSFLQGRENKGCLSQPEVELVTEDVDDWLTAQPAQHIHAFLIDVPISGSTNEWMDVALHKKIISILHDDSIVVVSSGSAPMLSDSYDQSDELNARDVLLRQSTRPDEVNGLDHYQVYVYDEPLAKPLASSFIALFYEDTDVINEYLQTNAPAIEIAIVKQLYTMASGPPTIVYDGATHANYHYPSRTWQSWYCSTSPGKDLYVCNSFLKDWYNPERHHYKTEVRHDTAKGRSLFALEAIPAGHFVLPDDAAMALRIDAQRWSLLNDFIDRNPDADMYRQLRDFFVAYGFESEPLGQTGWAVSVGNNSTYTNHACSEAAKNLNYVTNAFVDEDGGETRFSPIQVRFGKVLGVLSQAHRDITAGEEIQMDYAALRSYEGGAHTGLLAQICNSGVGMVQPADGEFLIHYDPESSSSDHNIDENKDEL